MQKGSELNYLLMHLRRGKERDLLARSDSTMGGVTWSVGHEDPGVFRNTFVRLMGLVPGEYHHLASAPYSLGNTSAFGPGGLARPAGFYFPNRPYSEFLLADLRR